MSERHPIFNALVITAGVIGGLFVTLSVLLADGNSLAHLCFYVLIGGGLLGLVVPRLGFFVWIAACGYSDLLKRLTIVFGEVTKLELIYILGITPTLFAGIVASLVIGGLTGAYPVRMAHWLLFFVGLAMVALTGAVYAFGGGGSLFLALQGIANGGLYSLALFVMPVLFPRTEDILRLLRFTLWVFVPVAIYGMVQQIHGFQPFEIAYLRTGLSIEIKQLFTTSVRAFSTLNSPTALGAVSALLVVVAWTLMRLPRPAPQQRRRWLSRPVGLLMIACFAGALLASTSRSAPLLIVFGMASAWCFIDPVRTRLFYLAIIGSFVALVAVSPWLLGHLDAANTWVMTDIDRVSFAGQLASVGTYSDRLFGFANVLRNPAAFSWFGCWDGNPGTLPSSLNHHDLVSAMLLRFGAVPLVLSIIGLARVLTALHARLRRLEDPIRRRLMATSIGVPAGLIFLSALSGNVLSVFPVNMFFWMFAGSAVVCALPVAASAPQPAANRFTGTELSSLAGRTPGCSRFGHRRPA